MNHALLQAAARLESLLAEETNALNASQAIDLADITVRKNQSLLEFSRLSRSIDRMTLSDRECASLDRLRASIETNRRTLELHVRASSQIADLIAHAIAADESDGTYSAHPGRRRTGYASETL